MRTTRLAQLTLRIGLWVAALCAPLAPACADYITQRGDTLSLTVLSLPALNSRMVVDSKGNVSVPLVGEVKAAEVSLSELTRNLQTMFAEKNIVDTPSIIVSVVEYAPIYVDGDVARPGEYKFRPEMTVRSAIAQAGGIDPTGGGLKSITVPQVYDARSDLAAATVELAKQTARTARFKAELAGAETFDAASVQASVGVDEAVFREIVGIEVKQMEATRTTRAHQQEHLTALLDAAQHEVTALERTAEQLDIDVKQTESQVKAVNDLMDAGVATRVRLEEVQRGLTQARAQAAECAVRLAVARKEVADRTRELDASRDDRQARTLEALNEAVAEAAKARSRITAAQERLAGRGNSQDNASRLHVVVRRIVNGAPARLELTPDDPLSSGDNIDVRAPQRARPMIEGPVTQ
ncbi:MAG: polysaccharide biosynthesis/export family protein [Alphaproteobacteria bacterium]|nr:polysaccharide biosynthesis/export family protein [Alphaproteobacteria bacterium]